MSDESASLPPRPTVLVVDDTPENLLLMQGLLKDHYKVKGANNGERGLKIAMGETPPDLILLDIMMPGIDGYEVCRQLKSEPKTRHIPVIFLTAKSQADDEALGLALGAVDYIPKPVSPPLVLARVRP
ncbi:MAG: two-component system response regulator, partial [Burkholderiales bacterium PBB4]